MSFGTDDWELKDYPISLLKQVPDPGCAYDDNPRFKLHPYAAHITNWNVSGTGASRDEALQDLSNTFAARKANLAEQGKPLPRPGTNVPLQFASEERVNAHQELLKDFIQRVLGFEWAFISDESTLFDFHTDRTNQVLLAKIRDVYGVSVDDIDSAKVWEILDRIAEVQNS